MRVSGSSRRPGLAPAGLSDLAAGTLTAVPRCRLLPRRPGRTGPMIEVHGRGVLSAGWHARSGLNPEGEVWTMKA